MPQIVTCPDCGRKLNVPDNLLGRNVRCPGCGQKFLADPGDDPDDRGPSGRRSGVSSHYDDDSPRGDYEDDAPRRRRRDEDDDYSRGGRRDEDDDRSVEPSKREIRQGWERVRLGVHLVIFSCWAFAGAAVTALLGWLLVVLMLGVSFGSFLGVFGATSQPQVSNAVGNSVSAGCAAMIGAFLFWGLFVLLLLACAALRVTGYGFTMGVAPTRKTQMLKGLAIAVFCLGLANVLLPTASCGGNYVMFRNEGGCLMVGGEGLAGLLMLAEFICFLLFVRGVAVVMKKDGLAQNLLIYMIVTPIYSLMLFALPLIAALGVFGAFFGAATASSSSSPAGAVNNLANAGMALFIGGLTCGGLMFALGVALFVWFVMLMHRVRDAIDGWLDRT